MKTLLDGIQTAFTNNTNLANSFANGCEVSLAKDAEALPLCVLTLLPPSAPQFQTGASPYVEVVIGQFSVYSLDPTFVQAREADLDTAFNGIKLTLSTDSSLICLKNGGGNPYRDSDDARVWRADYLYLFRVQRN